MIKITQIGFDYNNLRKIILSIDKKCYKRDIRFTEETLNNYLNEQARIYLVTSTKKRQTIIGYMLLYVYRRECYLSSLAILQTYQGAGIGKRLFKIYLDYMTNGNYTKMNLHAVNPAMIHIAEKNGFKKVRTTKEYYGKANATLMEKRK